MIAMNYIIACAFWLAGAVALRLAFLAASNRDWLWATSFACFALAGAANGVVRWHLAEPPPVARTYWRPVPTVEVRP